MLTAMARELVENKGIGESAQNVWRSIGQLRPEPPSRGTEELEFAQVNTGIPAVSEDTPVSPNGEKYPQPSLRSSEAEQLSLF